MSQLSAALGVYHSTCLAIQHTQLNSRSTQPTTGCQPLTFSFKSSQLCCRLSGNANVNQNPLLLTITTVLAREHNRRAQLIEAANPDWEDENIFQEARK
jgi:hypothetical protein